MEALMFSRRKKGVKDAGVTIEVSLSIVLSIVVLFLILGLIGDNIKLMAANGGINNLFKGNTAKTKTDNWNVDLASNKVAVTEIPVTTVADQGHTLEWYLDWAQETVDDAKSGKTALTNSQIEDLAKALTILSIDAGDDPQNYVAIANAHAINIELFKKDTETNTQFGKTSVEFSSNNIISITYATASNAEKLTRVKEIYKNSFS
jgi:hypothetical protein